MVWYKRLRWRLIGIQMMVVVIGIASMLLATRVLYATVVPSVIRPNLHPHINDPATLNSVETAILNAFQNIIAFSLTIAGTGAIVAGIIASILLWRTLMVPLRDIAGSSQRIADGHYDERVPVPQNGGEALHQLVTNFNQMASGLEQTEANRSTMVGNVAHELRTPLTGLRGVIEGMEDGVYDATPTTFHRLSSELDRLTRLVDDLQELSRVEAGAFPLYLQDFVLCDVVQAVLTHLQAQAGAKQITLTAHEAQPPLRVYADSDRTAQVLTNLISNAIRYTPVGGTVTIALSPSAGAAQIAVVDDGIGIAATDLPHLFDRFYRVDASRSRESGGSGVGLTIARHLTWAMGGEISAESSGQNKGSTFRIQLPLSNTNDA